MTAKQPLPEGHSFAAEGIAIPAPRRDIRMMGMDRAPEGEMTPVIPENPRVA